MSVILFLLVLFVLVLVHEWGHYITAKKTGMRVDEFGIGFPPKVWGKKKGETEYTLNLLPIGGFVKIYGEDPEAVSPDAPDKSRAFGSRPKWAQAVVLVAGIAMNIIFAWFLFYITFLTGVERVVDEKEASPLATLNVTQLLPESPLNNVVPVGSEIVSLTRGEEVQTNLTPTTFSDFVQASEGQNIKINYRHQGLNHEVEVVPQTGLLPNNPEKVAVGVSLALLETISYGPLSGLVEATKATFLGLINITVGLFDLLSGALLGTADFTQVAGPVGIVGLVGDAADYGLVPLLTFTAVISLNLAVINLLPIPALDGGRLLFVAIEAITRRPINPAYAGRLNLIGFVLLMILMVVVTYNDIVRLIN